MKKLKIHKYNFVLIYILDWPKSSFGFSYTVMEKPKLFDQPNTLVFFHSILYFWRRKWQSTPALLPGKSHGRRSLIGYSPWGRKESDTTERLHYYTLRKGFPGGSVVKNLPAVQETCVRSLGWEDPLEEEMAPHSSIPA